MKQEHIKSYYTINGLCLFIVCVILTSDLPQVRYSYTEENATFSKIFLYPYDEIFVIEFDGYCSMRSGQILQR